MTDTYKMCQDCHKRLYTSKRRARLATAKAKNRIRVYLCPTGKGYHVTDRQKGQH